MTKHNKSPRTDVTRAMITFYLQFATLFAGMLLAILLAEIVL